MQQNFERLNGETPSSDLISLHFQYLKWQIEVSKPIC